MKSLIIANATPSALSHPPRKQFIKTIDPDTRNSLAVPSSRESVGSIIPSFLRRSCQHRGSVTLDMSNQTFGSYWLFPHGALKPHSSCRYSQRARIAS